VFAFQVTGNGNQLGVNPALAIASGDVLWVTMTGRAAV
jgi:hypothetical protein